MEELLTVVLNFFNSLNVPCPTMDTQLTKNTENWVIWLLAAVNFTNVLDFMVLMPLGPQMKRVFSLSPGQWSGIVSSYTFAAFISGLLAVFIIDKYDRKKLLTYVYIGFSIATLLCGLSHTKELLIISRSLAGLFGGMLGALSLTIVGDIISFERRSKAIGKVMSGFSAAAALGVPVGLYFGTKFGWQIPFLVTAGVSVLNMLLIQFKFPSIVGHLEGKDKPLIFNALKEIFTNKNTILGLSFLGLLMLGHFTIIPFLSPYMVSNVGFLEEDLIYIYLTGGLISAVSSPLIGKWADAKGNKKVFTIFLLLSLGPIYLITNLTTASVLQVLPITMFFFIFSGGRFIPAMNLIMSTADPKIRGVFMSIRASIQNLFAGLGAVIAGGVMYENINGQFVNYDILGYCTIGFSLCCLLVIGSLKAKG